MKQRINTISEVLRSEIEIDPKIDLVDKKSKNEIKVAAMLQLQPHKVALQSKVANLGIQTNVHKLKKQLSTKTRLP